MDKRDMRETCHALAGRAEEIAVLDIRRAAQQGRGDSDACAVTGEQVLWLAQVLASDEDARILFNGLVMQLRAEEVSRG